MTTVNEIYSALEAVAKGIKSSSAAVEKAREKLAGTYNGAVAVAVTANSADQLEKAFDKLFTNIRTDGRLAVAVGAKKRKKAGKDGSKYTVPGGLMNAKSTLLAAMRFGISLVSDEGEVKAYRAILTEKQEHDATKAADNMSDDDKLRVEASEITSDLLEGLKQFGGNGLAEQVEALRVLRDAVQGVNQRAAELAEAA